MPNLFLDLSLISCRVPGTEYILKENIRVFPFMKLWGLRANCFERCRSWCRELPIFSVIGQQRCSFTELLLAYWKVREGYSENKRANYPHREKHGSALTGWSKGICWRSPETTGIWALGQHWLHQHRVQDAPAASFQALWRSVRKSRRVFTRRKLEARGVSRLFSKAEAGFTVITGPGLWLLQMSGR